MRTIGDLISQQPLFADLSPEQVNALVDAARYRRFRPGELVFRDGNLANRFFIIVHGEVALECPSKEGAVRRLQTVKAGEILGWSWTLADTSPRLSGRAMEPTDVVYFCGSTLRNQCEQDPLLGYRLFSRVAEGVTQRLQATRELLLRQTDQTRSN